MKTVISAGGKGTRISSVACDIPKPMITILGKSVLEYQIETLQKQGFDDIIITVGHLGEKIKKYFGDGSGISPVTGRPFGVKIEYYEENEPLGTAGALLKIQDKLTDDFLFINGDLFFDADLKKLCSFHKRKNAAATVFTHPNSHPFDSTLVVADKNNRVTEFITKENRTAFYKNRVNTGIHILSKKIFPFIQNKTPLDLDRDILMPIAGNGGLYCIDTAEYIKDMGTPERYEAVINDIQNGIPGKLSSATKRKAVFLDRDGTLNIYKGFLRDINDLELCDGAAEAVKKINDNGYIAVVVTNQPVIARGEVSENELREIHNKLETMLGKNGAVLNAIYYCPHHPDKGFDGEIAELKTECDCRKPKAGLLKTAAEDFNIDLAESFTVGDSQNDILAGKNAGTKTILIGNEDFGQDFTVRSLKEATDIIFGEKENEQ